MQSVSEPITDLSESTIRLLQQVHGIVDLCHESFPASSSGYRIEIPNFPIRFYIQKLTEQEEAPFHQTSDPENNFHWNCQMQFRPDLSPMPLSMITSIEHRIITNGQLEWMITMADSMSTCFTEDYLQDIQKLWRYFQVSMNSMFS